MRTVARLGMVVVILSLAAGMSSQEAGQGGTSRQADIGRSGTEFMSVCSRVGGGGSSDPQHAQSEATCLGWVEGFADGFTVHDELLGVPRADRMVCISRSVTNAQMLRAITKYIGSNPDKAHRATRLVASLALAQAFPCKRGK
jgi:Rap1a immunity proteins